MTIVWIQYNDPCCRIASLHTCVLYTVVRMEGGAIYWWRVLPVTQRKKLLGESFRAQYSNKILHICDVYLSFLKTRPLGMLLKRCVKIIFLK